jgi:hypothetical protein
LRKEVTPLKRVSFPTAPFPRLESVDGHQSIHFLYKYAVTLSAPFLPTNDHDSFPLSIRTSFLKLSGVVLLLPPLLALLLSLLI